MPNRECLHCGSKMPDSGGDFCCNGCEAAWDMIHNLGLDDYYTRKKGVTLSKIASNIFIAEELFSDSIKDSDNGLKTAVFYITSVRCAACVWLVENIICKIPGVSYVRVNYATFRTVVTFDPDVVSLKTVLEQVAKAGYPPLPDNPINNSAEKKDTFLRFAVGALFTMQLMLYSVALYAGYFQDMTPPIKKVMQLISWALATPVVFYTGYPFLKNSIRALKQKHLSMDSLVALGAGSAYIYSIAAIFTNREVYFDTAATILTLITLGRFIELAAKDRARQGVLSLLSLTPSFARVIGADGNAVLMPLSKIKKGDRIQILAGDRVPVDGTVIEGCANIDESMLTGEPIPKSKQRSSAVYAGTVNQDGSIIINAGGIGKNTVLARIVEAIESADISKTKLVSALDKISSVFIPAILIISAGTFIAHFVISKNTGGAVMYAVAVLVVACPCAMGLAVPIAVTTSFAKAASFGAYVKNGDLFQTLTKATRICFDKTGTLTTGKPEVETFETILSPDYFLNITSILERHSAHILAKTITDYHPSEFSGSVKTQETAGMGISGTINGTCAAVGRYSFIAGFIDAPDKTLYDSMQRAAESGKTVVAAAIDSKFAGFYTIHDPLRAEVAGVIDRIKERYEITILSGDNASVVSKTAGILGVDYVAEQTPFDKINVISSFQRSGGIVAMVGDGINDAPALRKADTSVAVGRNASDIAIDSADAILVRQDLTILENLIVLSRHTKFIIRENLFWAFIYNVIAIPLAAMGVIHPIASAICMSASSLIVVLNSLRLR